MQEMLYLIYKCTDTKQYFFMFDVNTFEFHFFYQNIAILATELNKVLPIKIEIVISDVALQLRPPPPPK